MICLFTCQYMGLWYAPKRSDWTRGSSAACQLDSSTVGRLDRWTDGQLDSRALR